MLPEEGKVHALSVGLKQQGCAEYAPELSVVLNQDGGLGCRVSGNGFL